MAGKVITIAQQKGGAGKTTLAAQLAVGFSCARLKVATIDIDPQASLTHWHIVRQKTLGDANEIFHAQLQGWRLQKEIRRLRAEYDVILIDSPPHTQTDATIAIREADMVLVPVQPSPMDLWACGLTLQKAKAEGVEALVVWNRVPARANLTEHMQRMLSSMNIKTTGSMLGNRVAFASSMLEGQGVAETESASSSLAVQEVFALVRELKKHKVLKDLKSAA